MSNIYGSYTGSAQNISNTNSADIAYAELESQIVALDVRVTENDVDIEYNESRINTLETEMDEVQAVTKLFELDTPAIGTTQIQTNLDMGYLNLGGVGVVDWRAVSQAGRTYGYINPGANNEYLLVNTLANGSSQSSFFSFYTRNIVTAVLKPLQILDDRVNFFARSITNCSTVDAIVADLTAVKTKTDLFTLNSPVAGTTRISTSFDLNYKNITNVGTLQTTSASVGGQVRSYINGTDGDYVLSNELTGSDTFISFVTRSIGGVLSYFRVRNTTVDFNSRTISNCPTTTTMGTNITINSNAISAIQTVNASQTTAINALDTRVTSTEATNVTQNTRLTAVESVNASQTTAINTNATDITALENTMSKTIIRTSSGSISISSATKRVDFMIIGAGSGGSGGQGGYNLVPGGPATGVAGVDGRNGSSAGVCFFSIQTTSTLSLSCTIGTGGAGGSGGAGGAGGNGGDSTAGGATTLTVNGVVISSYGGSIATYTTSSTGGSWANGLYGKDGAGRKNMCSNNYGVGGVGGEGGRGGYTIAITGEVVLGAPGGAGSSGSNGCIVITEHY